MTVSLVSESLRAARYLASVAAHLRRPVTLAEARAVLQRRLEQRGAVFLGIAREVVYGRSFNPYRQLLRHAGCEFGDLGRLVERDGVEGALQALFRAGVYLTVEELKGQRPVTRGTTAVRLARTGLRNPRWTAPSLLTVGASRSRRVPTYLAMFRDHAVNGHLSLSARGGLGWTIGAWWMGSIEGVALMFLRHWGQGEGPRRCFFWGLDVRSGPGRLARNLWGTRAIRAVSVLAGCPFPWPEHVPLEAPGPVARWLAEIVRRGGIPVLYTIPSAAVRVAEAAEAAGLDLSGARLWIGSEPVTVAGSPRSGASARNRFPSMLPGRRGRSGTAAWRRRWPTTATSITTSTRSSSRGPPGRQRGFPSRPCSSRRSSPRRR